MEQGYDFAAGSRFIGPGKIVDGRASRTAISRGGTALANWLLGTRMHDMCSGFECFSRRAMAFVVARGVHSRAHFFQTEIRFMLRDWRWIEVPIQYRAPSGRVPLRAITEAFSNLWRLRRTRHQPASPG